MAKKRDSGRCGIPFGLLLLKTSLVSDELSAILLRKDYSLPGDKPIRIGPAEYPG